MTAFPTYDAPRIDALNTQAAAILSVFASHGYTRVETSVLQPAEIFLDRAGEEIRRRTFVLTDPTGRELCLRPDLTIPVCRMYLAQGGTFPARLCYNGLVFRHQPAEPERPTQFFQAGAELLGLDDRTVAEMEVLSLTVEAVRAAGLDGFEMRLGDLALFGAFIDALDIAPQLGIRETRRLVGEAMLTADDVLACADFADTIGVNGWPLELHVAGDVEWRWPPIPESRGFNQLPYRMLLPRRSSAGGVDNLLVAGRCASMTHEGHSAARVSGACFVMGQAAGTAAALGLRRSVPPHAVPAAELQQMLEADGAFLGR